MTVTRETEGRAGKTEERGRDPGRYAGVAFALTFLVGVSLWGAGPSVYDSDPETFAADSVDTTMRVLSLVNSHLLMPLAAVFLLWTAVRLRNALSAAGATSVAGQVALGAATVTAGGFCVLAAAQHTALLVAGGDHIDGFKPDPAVGYDLALLSGNVGNATVWGASVLMVAWAPPRGASSCCPAGWSGAAT